MEKDDETSHECEFCGYVGTDVEYEPDPYEHCVNGDDTKHWICRDCFCKFNMDV